MDTLVLSTSVCLPLRVCSKFHYNVSGRSSLSWLCSQWHVQDICRITREKTSLFDIWSMLSQPCAVCTCMCVPAFLDSAWMHALNINISLNDRYVKLIFTDVPDPWRTRNDTAEGDCVRWAVANCGFYSLQTVFCDLGAVCLQWCCFRRSVREGNNRLLTPACTRITVGWGNGFQLLATGCLSGNIIPIL